MNGSKPFAPSLAKTLSLMERALVLLSGLSMAAIMMVVVADVVMRYAFNSPLVWSYDLISLYLMVALFFFALSHTLEQHGHVCIDILVGSIPRRARHLAEGVGYGITTLLMGQIAWLSAERTVTAFINNDLIAGAISWPAWMSQVPVVLGAGVLTLRCLYRAVAHLLSVFSATSRIAFAMTVEDEDAEGEAHA